MPFQEASKTANTSGALYWLGSCHGLVLVRNDDYWKFLLSILDRGWVSILMTVSLEDN